MMTRRPAILVSVALLVVGLALITNVVPFRQILEQQRRVEEASTHLAALTQENQLLEDQVAALQTPAEIERLAREELGYVKAGEIGFVVLQPEAPPPATVGAEAVTSPSAPRSWYARIWDFLTGADLSGRE
jgi:cell division protein FtsB